MIKILVAGKNQQYIEPLVEMLRQNFTVCHARQHDEFEEFLHQDIALIILEQDFFEVPLERGHLARTERADKMSALQCQPSGGTNPPPLRMLLGNQSGIDAVLNAIRQDDAYHHITHSWTPQDIVGLAKRGVEHSTLLQHYDELLKERIRAEKLLSLGQLVADVAHEINTPASAIHAATGNLHHHLKHFQNACCELEKNGIAREHVRLMLSLIRTMLTNLGEKTRSSIEVRTERKEIAVKLEQHQLENSDAIARELARIGLYEELDTFLKLADLYGMQEMLSFFTHCSRILHAAKDIKLSIGVLEQFAKALKTYSHPWQENPEIIDIHHSIETALLILNSKLKHQIYVDFRPGDLPKISCYSSELSHIWLNLLHNAIQAIEGEGTITIETSASEQDVCVKITDTGSGIPKAIQHRIFESTFTTKSPEEGTGLGLHIVRQIIEKHHGTIEFSSRPGQTTFNVRLPLHST